MKRIKRLTPSPALVIACIALFVALGGSAYAAVVITGKNVKNYSLTGKDIKKNGIGGVTIKESRLGTVPSAAVASSINHTAVVGSAGQFVRGKGVIGSIRVGEGRYQVAFNQNVQGCVPVASVGDPSAAGPPTGSASTALLAANPSAIQVRTSAANTGAAADRPFSLVVNC